MSYHKIPHELRLLNQWVVWKMEVRGGKQTKLPYNAKRGTLASTTNPETWTSFDEALEVCDCYDGLGFVFTKETPYFGIDIDSIDSEYAGLADFFGTYAEKSQSGKGLHIIGRGKLEKGGRRKSTGEHKGVEVYDSGRYFVMTGNTINGLPVADCQVNLNEFVLSEFGKEEDAKERPSGAISTSITETDAELIELAENADKTGKFSRLWRGDKSDYQGDHSRADAGLVEALCYWTRRDEVRSRSLYRQSGLYRPIKGEREDYWQRTWALACKNANIRPEQIEVNYPEPEMLKEHYRKVALVESKKPWKSVTIEDVKEAIKGTVLQDMCEAIQEPTYPVIPLEVALLKSLSLCGCALSQQSKTRKGGGNLNGVLAKGHDLAKVMIQSGNGQVCNFYTLIIGRSASGKDVGGVAKTAAIRFGWDLGSGGSSEGVMDALMRVPNGLFQVSELKEWIDPKTYNNKATSFLTGAFNAGSFTSNLSKRSDAAERRSDFCFPSICASIQPGVLEDLLTRLDVESGFLGRFLIAQMPLDAMVSARSGDFSHANIKMASALGSLMLLDGPVVPPDGYNLELEQMFMANKAEPYSAWRRLCGEYYPRMALILSRKATDASPFPVITDDGWARARTLVYFFFRQAEEVFGRLFFSPEQSKLERDCDKFQQFIWGSPRHVATLNDIGQRFKRGGNAKLRKVVIEELLERGEITKDKASGGFMAIRPPEAG